MGATVYLRFGRVTHEIKGSIFVELVRSTFWEIYQKEPEVQNWFKSQHGESDPIQMKATVEFGDDPVMGYPDNGYYFEWVRRKGSDVQEHLFSIVDRGTHCMEASDLEKIFAVMRKEFPAWKAVPAEKAFPQKGLVKITWEE